MRKIFAIAAVALVYVAVPMVAIAQDHATAEEVVAKVREAASTLSQTHDLTPFTQKDGPWVWKDTYVFVNDCDKKVVAANIVRPDQVGQDFGTIKDGEDALPGPESLLRCREEAFRQLGRVLVAMTGDRKPIKHLREALHGVLFISALELRQTPPTILSVAYEQLLAESVPGDKRGRTFCELIAAVVVARALDGDQRAKRELRDALSPPRVPFVLELSKTNCLGRV